MANSLIDDFKAPDMFATAVSGYSNVDGTITITLECARPDYTGAGGPVTRVVIGRLVMPIRGAQALATELSAFLSRQGHPPTAGIETGTTRQ